MAVFPPFTLAFVVFNARKPGICRRMDPGQATRRNATPLGASHGSRRRRSRLYHPRPPAKSRSHQPRTRLSRMPATERAHILRLDYRNLGWLLAEFCQMSAYTPDNTRASSATKDSSTTSPPATAAKACSSSPAISAPGNSPASTTRSGASHGHGHPPPGQPAGRRAGQPHPLPARQPRPAQGRLRPRPDRRHAPGRNRRHPHGHQHDPAARSFVPFFGAWPAPPPAWPASLSKPAPPFSPAFCSGTSPSEVRPPLRELDLVSTGNDEPTPSKTPPASPPSSKTASANTPPNGSGSTAAGRPAPKATLPSTARMNSWLTSRV